MNISTDPVIGLDQSKSKVGVECPCFNKYTPYVTPKRMTKVSNAYWNRAAQLVFKCCDCVAETYLMNPWVRMRRMS